MRMPSKERVTVWLWLKSKGKQGMWLELGEVGLGLSLHNQFRLMFSMSLLFPHIPYSPLSTDLESNVNWFHRTVHLKTDSICIRWKWTSLRDLGVFWEDLTHRNRLTEIDFFLLKDHMPSWSKIHRWNSNRRRVHQYLLRISKVIIFIQLVLYKQK